MALFGFGAFSTPVGQLVERATDNAASAGNLSLHLEICDQINSSDNGPKEAVAAIRKRLTGSSKNFHIINLTLTVRIAHSLLTYPNPLSSQVLETCVKNCGIRFHSKIAQKDFLSDLMKVIAVKNNPPTIVRERILGLIQYWADAFTGKPQLAAVGELYEQLKSEGIEFPPIDLDNLAPVETQGRPSLQLTEQPSSTSAVPAPAAPTVRQEAPIPTGPLRPEQVEKLLSELDLVRKNMDIMNEIMSENEPGKESADDKQLLDDLNRIVHSMHTRVAGLIARCTDEIVLGSTLQINDDLNSLFVRYERWLKNSAAAKQTGEQDTLVSSTGVATTNLIEPSAPTEGGISYPSLDDPPSYDTSEQLIDLGTEVTTAPTEQPSESGVDIINQLAQLGITTTGTESQPPPPSSQQDEFDMFAKSRTAYAGTGSTYADNMVDQNVSLSAAVHGRPEGAPPTDPYADLTDWLGQTETKPETSGAAPTSTESATSSEFDQFLALRANKGEGLPAARPRPQMQKEEEREDELFQL